MKYCILEMLNWISLPYSFGNTKKRLPPPLSKQTQDIITHFYLCKAVSQLSLFLFKDMLRSKS